MSGKARYLKADRSQASWDVLDLEALLGSDHRVRLVWSFVEGLELAPFYEGIRSLEGAAGRPPADPRVLLALWLYATIEGVGSARELDRLVKRDLAYRWLAGGVPVNHHGLADFRVAWSDELDRLLSQSVTALVSEGLVTLDEVALDGTKIRACASPGSYTRGGRLERIEREAGERIALLKQELEGDAAAASRRRKAARERAAREARAKVDRARAALERLRREKKAREKTHGQEEKKKGEPCVSLSDPEARRLRFGDGAVRAGYNVQTAATPRQGVILAVEVNDRRNDSNLAKPMAQRVVDRYGPRPRRLLIDEGYGHGDIQDLADPAMGPFTVYAPLPKEKPDHALKPQSLASRRSKRGKEPRAVKEWRRRMTTEDAKAVFKRRKLIELIHAHYKNRALARLTVTGIAKARAVVLWHALANNLLATFRLRAQAAQPTPA